MSLHKLQVALVTETYAPEVNGVAMTLGRLTSGLLDRGHRVRIVRPRQKHESAGLLPNGDLLTAGLPIPRYPELRFGLPTAGLLRRLWLEQRPDIVHVATEGPLGFSALAAARAIGIPALSSFHTNFHNYSQHYGIGWLRPGIEQYLRWFHNRTATTLVPTATQAAELETQGYRNIQVLSRGVDTGLFNPARRSQMLRTQWEAQPNDPVCLIVSRLAPEKNLELAFAAFSAIRAERPNARLVCVGDGPSAAGLARRHPIAHFSGLRQGEDLAAHYASADLFLFPSLTETFGNVVSEALASGLPVVAYDRAAASELIQQHHNGWLVKPGDDADFISASRHAARQVTQRQIDRKVCAASVRHMSWERIHERYEAALKTVAALRSPLPDAVLPAPTFGI